jgi:epoxyqueuosine reductase
VLTSDAVKTQALALGFDLCGVAPAGAFPELAFFREWLDRGYAGEMDYLARSADRRADVRTVLPGARSVVVLATLYNTVPPYTPDVAEAGVARISRYAWGDDYHDVLQKRLGALLAWMRDTSTQSFEARAYVDTGPVQERAYAQYAGLGWIGKNTCLINPELGSWVFLSEIITTLPLDVDVPGIDQCGSCTRCLDACPTEALVAPGVLDARRCLSYLTIELRGEIPADLRPALGAHVYGCDICQDVCPYNQAAPVSADPAWVPRPGLNRPTLAALWQQTDAELRALTRGSAMRRARLVGLRRNLAVAIGNSGDPSAIDMRAGEPAQPSAADGMVGEHVAWAVARSRS